MALSSIAARMGITLNGPETVEIINGRGWYVDLVGHRIRVVGTQTGVWDAALDSCRYYYLTEDARLILQDDCRIVGGEPGAPKSAGKAAPVKAPADLKKNLRYTPQQLEALVNIMENKIKALNIRVQALEERLSHVDN